MLIKNLYFFFMIYLGGLLPSFAQKKSIKILSYNIHHASPPTKPGTIELDNIVRIIKESKADIVALQEVDVLTERSNQVNQAKVIAEKTKMIYYFSKAIDYKGGEYGVAILSKFPLKNQKSIALPQVEKAEGRVLSIVELKVGKSKLLIANTHLDAQKDEANRIAQMNYIVNYFKDQKNPIILCGDFNAQPVSETINILDKSFTRACLRNCESTFPQVNPRMVIDYIASKNLTWELNKFDVLLEEYASDHRPILAEYYIK